MSPVPSDRSCPSWCRRASQGHGYQDDGSGFWHLTREHVSELHAPGISVELVQVERARTPRGPVELGPVTAFVFADENDNALGASQLRHAARCLAAAADEVDRLTPAIDL